MEIPCRECDRRSAECHSTCLDYKEWKEHHAAEKEALRRARALSNEPRAYFGIKSQRMKKRYAKKGEQWRHY